MSASSLITFDLALQAVAAAAWIGAGVLALRGRPSWWALAPALALTVARAGSVALLWGQGWWFAQEKVTVTLPLALAAAVIAVVFRRSGAGALTAGYAALTGLGVTFLSGYPATPSVGLIAVAIVAGAGLVTWQAVGGSPLRSLGIGTAVAGLAGIGLAFLPPSAYDFGGGPDAHMHGMTMAGASAPAGGTVRRYTLTARKATITLPSGRRFQAWTFDGTAPGPAITATVGDTVEVTLRNADIEPGVTLHWHGYDVPNAEDGVPGLTQKAVPPGGSFVYRFTADQAGTYWYHTHEVSDEGVRLGLYGTFVVTPRPAAGVDLTVPAHTFGGELVTGAAPPAAPPGTPVRLRLVNTDSVTRRFALAGTPYKIIAVDGRDLHGPGTVTGASLRLPAGGRYDLAFTMPAGPVALYADGRPTAVRFGRGLPPYQDAPDLDLTTYGTAEATPFGLRSRFDRRFTLVLDRGLALVDGIPQYAQTVNGLGYPRIPAQVVREGDLVMFTVVNRSLDTHPWHLHGHHVLVLSKDGRAPTGAPLWLDTFEVRPGEVWQVGFRADNPGMWMNHCHNLAHADQGMMLHLMYAPDMP
ncbi:multicopper oxidase family protein [Streptosporangiaceae bacterium NEAU-GS5]|nr:multicopper oxidase family protein [Streptosporangiaceae bacterium NEAU-GS5]